jgi:hypothetical protein
MKTSFSILLFVLIISARLCAQDLARFEINTGKIVRMDALICVPLNGLNFNTDSVSLQLFETKGKDQVAVPFQIENNYTANLWFTIPGKVDAGLKKTYLIKKVRGRSGISPVIKLDVDDKTTTMRYNNQPVLSYNHAIVFPPQGIDPKYKRSGFIHPLWAPSGEILTRIQAPDHYHHYGIWNPWTVTHIDGKEVDFWNLAKGEGTVKFAGYLDAVEGPVYGGFRVRQEHVTLPDESVAINEVWDVRTWNTGNDKTRLVDLITTLNTPLKNGILLDAYRYGGGIGYRALEKWNNKNSSVLTSDGKTRQDADGSFARWCIVEGESIAKEGRSGILFLSHPSNRMHPEPMRVWPPDMNGRGDLYFEFVPIRHVEWKLNTMQDYTLKYRMVVFDGKMDKETAELYWNSFAFLPEVQFIEQRK